jgi:muramoyltetrapeptide carboxypeptidase
MSSRRKDPTVKARASRASSPRTRPAAAKAAPAPRARVGIIATSSPAPLVELQLGAGRLQDEGFEVYLHPQVRHIETFFAGSDAERALALLDYAFDPELDVVWGARGGYGAVRILPILDEVVSQVGKPEPKTLVGFSDLTILLEYVRTRWGWRTIHGPMPATFHIERVKGADWDSFTEILAGGKPGFDFKLEPVHRPKSFGAAASVRGPVVGGNLAMIQSVLGTPYAFDLKGKILFLEEIGEAPYRIDRMLQHLLLAGALEGVKAIVLGTFTHCDDSSPQVYAAPPKRGQKAKMKPLRRTLSGKDVFAAIFGEVGETLGIPVFQGIPVGHGNGPASIELGIASELTGKGRFRSID